MATQDISRFLHQPNKHYTTVHMQQGRVIVDSDWNERASTEAEDLRSSLVDIMCSCGTPNDGMLISNPLAVSVDPAGSEESHATYVFDIAAGSYYLGGLRFSVDTDEGFLRYTGQVGGLGAQTDWLQIDSTSANMPPQVVAIAGPDENARIDLVFVYASEQPVTAVEDRELREVALGGRDSSVRVKRTRCFKVFENVLATDCALAFGDFTSALVAGYGGSFDLGQSEFLSGARLQVNFVASAEEEDLCADPTSTGYVAAENQAIRVEIRTGGKLVWGFDNASKLYRVTVSEGGNDTLTFLNEPEDLPSMPRTGQVVEVLQWGALLPNQEKVAETQGMLTKVATTYDPITKQLVIADGVSTDWTDWLAAHTDYHNLDDETSEREYLYLRVWDRGSDVTSDAELDYTGGDVTLGTTGLSVTVVTEPTTAGLPGDYWIIAARPSTPDAVTPWDLTDVGGVARHGPRRFFAPLATISWDEDGDGVVTPTVSDCRTRLRRLCEGGCCTVTVGDGQRSFGQVSTLQDAIDLVPDGGKICLLPGVHEGTATFFGRSDIVLEGCGPTSVLKSPAPASSDPVTSNPESFYAPVLMIRDSERIQIKDLRIESHAAIGVAVEQTELGTCDDILLEGLEVFGSGTVNEGNGVLEYAGSNRRWGPDHTVS